MFFIDGTAIKNPTTFKVERYNITTMHRLTNGTMTGDFVAHKRKFYFNYAAITNADFNVILSKLFDTEDLFHDLEYTEEGETKQYKVYVGSIPSPLHKATGIWTWKNVTFNLIEQ